MRLTKATKQAVALVLFLGVALAAAGAVPKVNSSASQASAAGSAPLAKASSSNAAVSPADIAAAKASHKVWVNLDSGIYHKGGRWYGKTKNGKFMTADEAKKAGYKAAKRD